MCGKVNNGQHQFCLCEVQFELTTVISLNGYKFFKVLQNGGDVFSGLAAAVSFVVKRNFNSFSF